MLISLSFLLYAFIVLGSDNNNSYKTISDSLRNMSINDKSTNSMNPLSKKRFNIITDRYGNRFYYRPISPSSTTTTLKRRKFQRLKNNSPIPIFKRGIKYYYRPVVATAMTTITTINPSFLMIVSKSLEDRLPKVLCGIIEEYIHNPSFYNLYNRIMDKMQMAEKERNYSSIYSDEFVSRIIKLINDNYDKIHSEQSLLHDIMRLVFKWTLDVGMFFASQEKLFESTVNRVKWIIDKLDGMIGFYPLGHVNLDSMKKFSFSIFQHLLRYESYENQDLLDQFVNHVTKDLYDQEGDPDQDQSDDHHFPSYSSKPPLIKMTFQQLQTKYFNGNINNNPLLMMMILQFIPLETSRQMIKVKYFPDEYRENLNFYGDATFISGLSGIHSQSIGLKNEGMRILESDINICLVDTLMIEFFLKNNLGIRITSHFFLVDLLRRLKEIGQLYLVPIERIIKFFKSDQGWKWNKDMFMKYLSDSKKTYLTFGKHSELLPDEYDEYIKLVVPKII